MSRAKRSKLEGVEDDEAGPLMRPANLAVLQDNQSLQNHWECPVCLDILLPPIYVCKSGHSVCHVCFKGLSKKCPLCKLSLTGQTRNFTLENLYQITLFECSYKDDGCDLSVSGMEFQSHTSSCLYRPKPCPFARNLVCHTPLSYSNLLNHIRSTHCEINPSPAGTLVHRKHPLHLITTVPFRKTWLFKDQLFISEMSTETTIAGCSKITFSLYLIGEITEAQQYRAELTIIRPGLNCCSPNIVKGYFDIPVKSIREKGTSSRVHIHLTIEKDFQPLLDPPPSQDDDSSLTLTYHQVNSTHLSLDQFFNYDQEYIWIERLDLKKRSESDVSFQSSEFYI